MFLMEENSSHAEMISDLKLLNERFSHCFPSVSFAESDWVRDPWSSCALECSKHLPVLEQEQLAEMREDQTLKIKTWR